MASNGKQGGRNLNDREGERGRRQPVSFREYTSEIRNDCDGYGKRAE